MSAAERVLALDLGSSSARALVLDVSAGLRVDALARRPVRIELGADGSATIAPEGYVRAVRECLDDLRDSDALEGVTRVAVASQWHSLLVIDRGGRPTTPVFTWAGNQELPAPDVLPGDAEELRLATGCALASLYWTLRAPWLRSVGALPAGAQLVSLATYVLESLLDHRVESVSVASGTGLVNLESQEWHTGALEVAGLHSTELADLVPTGQTVVGGQSLSRCYPQLASVPWHLPLGDGAAATVGSGALPGRDLTLTVGTSAAVRLLERRGSAAHLQPGCWRYVVDEHTVVTGQAWSGGGNLFAWAQEVLRLPGDPAELDDALSALTDRAVPTAVPYLYGPRPGNPPSLRSGRWTELTAEVTAAGLLGSLLDGLGFELRLGVATLTRQAGQPMDRVLLGGGAVTASRWWQRRLAEQLSPARVHLVTEPDVTALGVAAHSTALAWTPLLDDLTSEAGAPHEREDRFENYLRVREEAIG